MDGAVWKQHTKHVFVVTSAGKPVWSRWGDPDSNELSTLCSILQAVHSRCAEGGGDNVQTIATRGELIVFSTRGPLLLAAVCRNGESPHALGQLLRALHGHLLLGVTSKLHARLDARPGTDVRPLLVGTDLPLRTMLRLHSRSPALWLDAYPCLSLPPVIRARACQVLASAGHLDSRGMAAASGGAFASSGGVVYAILLAGYSLVAWAQPRSREHALRPLDVSLLSTFLACSGALRVADAWTPLCLPGLSEGAYVHAYISCLGSVTGAVGSGGGIGAGTAGTSGAGTTGAGGGAAARKGAVRAAATGQAPPAARTQGQDKATTATGLAATGTTLPDGTRLGPVLQSAAAAGSATGARASASASVTVRSGTAASNAAAAAGGSAAAHTSAAPPGTRDVKRAKRAAWFGFGGSAPEPEPTVHSGRAATGRGEPQVTATGDPAPSDGQQPSPSPDTTPSATPVVLTLDEDEAEVAGNDGGEGGDEVTGDQPEDVGAADVDGSTDDEGEGEVGSGSADAAGREDAAATAGTADDGGAAADGTVTVDATDASTDVEAGDTSEPADESVAGAAVDVAAAGDALQSPPPSIGPLPGSGTAGRAAAGGLSSTASPAPGGPAAGSVTYSVGTQGRGRPRLTFQSPLAVPLTPALGSETTGGGAFGPASLLAAGSPLRVPRPAADGSGTGSGVAGTGGTDVAGDGMTVPRTPGTPQTPQSVVPATATAAATATTATKATAAPAAPMPAAVPPSPWAPPKPYHPDHDRDGARGAAGSGTPLWLVLISTGADGSPQYVESLASKRTALARQLADLGLLSLVSSVQASGGPFATGDWACAPPALGFPWGPSAADGAGAGAGVGLGGSTATGYGPSTPQPMPPAGLPQTDARPSETRDGLPCPLHYLYLWKPTRQYGMSPWPQGLADGPGLATGPSGQISSSNTGAAPSPHARRKALLRAYCRVWEELTLATPAVRHVLHSYSVEAGGDDGSSSTAGTATGPGPAPAPVLGPVITAVAGLHTTNAVLIAAFGQWPAAPGAAIGGVTGVAEGQTGAAATASQTPQTPTTTFALPNPGRVPAAMERLAKTIKRDVQDRMLVGSPGVL